MSGLWPLGQRLITADFSVLCKLVHVQIFKRRPKVLVRCKIRQFHARDVHGNGIPVGMGIPWHSHGNGNEKPISVGMGMLENAL